ncbi:MAG: hypothetical protein EOO22_03195 [Comamonadaceae bacterium]|nr:MAG: hypothetical protein EOO22_03195 [Comamonadaceae bacterium]
MLNAAYEADCAAFAAIALDSKSFWSTRPLDCWPKVDAFRAWTDARVALIAAEKAVIEVLRWRCVAIRLGLPMDSVAPKYADLVAPAYVEQRVDTTRDDLNPADFLSANPNGQPAAIGKPDRRLH